MNAEPATALPRCACLITSGAEFIGSLLGDALLAEGHRLLVINNMSSVRQENGTHLAAHSQF